MPSFTIPESDDDGNLPDTGEWLVYCAMCGSPAFEIHYNKPSMSYDVSCIGCYAVVSVS